MNDAIALDAVAIAADAWTCVITAGDTGSPNLLLGLHPFRVHGNRKEKGAIVYSQSASQPDAERLLLYENVLYSFRIELKPGYSHLEVESSISNAGLGDWLIRRETNLVLGWFRFSGHLGIASLRIGVDEIRFEVASAKLDYQTEYRSMLRQIAEVSHRLLLNWSAPTASRTYPGGPAPEPHLLEQFVFLKGDLSPDQIRHYFSAILARTSTISEIEHRWMATDAARSVDLAGDPLGAGAMWSKSGSRIFPKVVREAVRSDSVDTAENQFVKFALREVKQIADRIVVAFEGGGGIVYAEARAIVDAINEILNHPLWRQIGPLSRIPFESQVLQKREGYRDILRLWLTSLLSAHVKWDGLSDAYNGHVKNVPRLYEYWAFFVMYDILVQLGFSPEGTPAKGTFVVEDAGSLTVGLKSGRESVAILSRKGVRAHLYYNRLFGAGQATAQSYSRPFQPDITLLLLPRSGTIESASAAESHAAEDDQLVILHFDAKYRIDKLQQAIGDPSDIAGLSPDSPGMTYKALDLIKMHAYKDAIRRTSGAYVLYPGTAESSALFPKYHEIVPGVGAFTLRPSAEGARGKEHIRSFIEDVIALRFGPSGLNN